MPTITTNEAQVALRSIRGHAKRIADATAARDLAIRGARAAGVPLRTIADAAGVTHQTVQNIIDRLENAPMSHVIDTRPFDCLECGKHVGALGRSDRPWHILRPGRIPAQWSFCSDTCRSTYTDRFRKEHGDEVSAAEVKLIEQHYGPQPGRFTPAGVFGDEVRTYIDNGFEE